MKINIIILTLFFFLFSKLNAGQILIRVNNIDEESGFIHFAIYDEPKFFPEKDGKKIGFKKNVKEIINKGVIIKDLEESYYAVAIYHDKNSNGKFDTFLAIPEEKYGFSNNAQVFFGPPSFEEVAIYLEKNKNLEIEINLR